MRIIDRFSREHDAFVIQLDELRAEVNRGGDVRSAIERIRVLATPLLQHAHNEEVLLFPDLVVKLGGETGGPVGVLREEHVIIHGQVDRLSADPARAEFDQVFAAFDKILREHIAKEEEVVFPLSAQLLGDERLIRMNEEIPAAV
jgi:iron-sulfur cluster repair protein YtfE (RIC family)